jgi:hypothetical protein
MVDKKRGKVFWNAFPAVLLYLTYNQRESFQESYESK